MKNLKTYKKFFESHNNSFEIISHDFFKVEIDKNNKRELSNEYLINFKEILIDTFDKLNDDLIFNLSNDNETKDVYVIEDEDYTNTFTIFRTNDDMIIVCYAMVCCNDLLLFDYRFDYYDQNGLIEMSNDITKVFTKYVIDEEDYITESNNSSENTYKEVSQEYFMDDRLNAEKEEIDELYTESIRNIVDDEFGYFITEISEHYNEDSIYQGFDKASNFIIEFFKVSDDWVLLFILAKGRDMFYKIDYHDLVNSVRNIMTENKLHNYGED